ncbi:hypothetical protein, conserved [Plasmodium gonderi]|uniref:Peptidase A2 domain-containing protein n=1 Tax=Plasmodium gonderi TaxID=77519 RepID=A0A1Y1JF41_PLAGO|nr:hypothetical protein, conserved [Plasmodium gonderi]GAW79955.1 hypothetical protein, conserved [Plasmodium gonderi]
MPSVFAWVMLFFLLCDFYDTLKLRNSTKNIIHTYDNSDSSRNARSFSPNSNVRQFFINNKNVLENRLRCDRKNLFIKRNVERDLSHRKEELFMNRKEEEKEQGVHKNEMKINKFKNSNGHEFLCTNLLMNNEEKNFIVDLCSDNSFMFDKKEDFFDRSSNGKSGVKGQGLLSLCLWFDKEDIHKTHEEIYLNRSKIEVDKLIKAKGSLKKNNTFHFYVMKDEGLDKHFDGILGFDFFSKFETFLFDTINMIIHLGDNSDDYHRAMNRLEMWKNKDLYEKIELHNYSNHIKYFHIDVNNHLYKGLLDSGTSKTLVVNSDMKLEKEDPNGDGVIIENILNEKFKVNKLKKMNRFHIVSKENKLLLTPLQMNEIYTSENKISYLDSNVVLLGLDFFLNKKFLFDLKNSVLYVHWKSSDLSFSDQRDKRYIKSSEKQENDRNNSPIDEFKVNEKCSEIYEQLKNKELSFLKMSKELEKENISMHDCKSTNDVIKKYAIKILYGSEYLSKNASDGRGKEFDERYKEITNFFKKLNSEEKQNMLNKIVNILKNNYYNTIGGGGAGSSSSKKRGENDKENITNEYEKASEILEKYVKYEIENKQYSLHRFKSWNVNRKSEKAVDEEYNHLLELYNAHPEYSFEILNDFKKELSSKRINVNNIENENEIIKKVAESRVYNNHQQNNFNKEGRNKRRKNIIVRRFTNDGNNVHTQIIIRRNGLDQDGENDNNGSSSSSEEGDEYGNDQYGNFDKMDDIFPNSLFSGIFKNFFGDSNRSQNYRNIRDGDGTDESYESDGSDENDGRDESGDNGGGDLFSELNNLFGFGNIGENIFRKKKKKSVIGFKTKEPNNLSEEEKEGTGAKNKLDSISEAIKEEKDVDIIYLLNKVQKLNDENLKNFILQSLKNENVRKILVDALKKGYQNTYEQCQKKNDNKSMYLLQMLKQTGVF